MARKNLGRAASLAVDGLSLGDVRGLLGSRNRLINGSFVVNQRGYASNTALAAGAYGHDRWKAGASGCTYTFAASGNDTTATITAGTLVQVVEGANVEGGAYILSWTGTAQARVYQGSASGAYAASPLTVTGLSGAADTTVEFGTGTLGRAQLEPGLVATPFDRRLLGSEIALCQRYYYRQQASSAKDVICMLSAFSTTQIWGKLFDLPVEMRAVPVVGYSALNHIRVWKSDALTFYSPTAIDVSVGSSQRSIGCYNGITLQSDAGLTTGQALFMTFQNAAGWIDAAAEM